MLSINSNQPVVNSQIKIKSFVGDPLPKPEGALSFKGKPISNEMKKFYEMLEKQRVERVLNNPDLSKSFKKEFLLREINAKVMQIWNESAALGFLKKYLR